MTNTALNEGTADAFAALLQDDPVGGKGFFGPGTYVRTALNTNTWPDDFSPDPHLTGLIISGALWNLRQAIDLQTTRALTLIIREA
jgi:hypothetical protein